MKAKAYSEIYCCQFGEVRKVCIFLGRAFAAVATSVAAEEQVQKVADEIAKELANPNNSLAGLNFKNQYRWYTGDLPNAEDQGNYLLLFQPVFPFPLPRRKVAARRICSFDPPSVDTVVVWFSTGKQQEEIVARSISKYLGALNE